MAGVWGKNIKYSIFGESHGEGLGIVIDGLPSGIHLDLKEIKREMDRRRPGKTSVETPRKEQDEFKILSGYFNQKTTGAPLCIFIQNKNQQSKDYDSIKNMIRPGHADYTAHLKYNSFHDYRGGGHFSGRLTAPIVFAGAVAKQLLKEKGILIGAHISQVGDIADQSFDKVNIDKKTLASLNRMNFPVLDPQKGEEMKELILKVSAQGDSMGGIVETAVVNIPGGMGEPFFDSLESNLAHLFFSIPAVKGVEFGQGFQMASMKGSEANDEFYMDNTVKTHTNHNGGILGGISNGMPIVFRVAFKPTPSISQEQRTIDFVTKKDIKISTKGRHDPCIVPRAVPVVEAMTAMGILEFYQRGKY